ncbi:MAG TPA: hypothetical protein P5277_02510 [Candidatus Paceibacterota bacterium]|nr:hypothetical protein [Candidatus Paceibacterota bacterium]
MENKKTKQLEKLYLEDCKIEGRSMTCQLGSGSSEKIINDIKETQELTH